MKFNRRNAMRASIILAASISIPLGCFAEAATLVRVHKNDVSNHIGQDDNQRLDPKPLNAWRTLVPLRSTRADVERLLGEPQLLLGSRRLYKFEKENVAFTYAKGNCDPFDERWNLPSSTILEIEVIPQKRLVLTEAGFDPPNFVGRRSIILNGSSTRTSKRASPFVLDPSPILKQ